MEGLDPSATNKKIWEDLARTEMRLQLMSALIKINLGLADIEEFNLDLKGNLTNIPSVKTNEMLNMKLVRAAMSVKIKDEQTTRGKLVRERNKARSGLMKQHGRNTKKYRTAIRGLRKAAQAAVAYLSTNFQGGPASVPGGGRTLRGIARRWRTQPCI